MTELKEDTENRILDAARKVFLEKGLDGARMQEIADEAKINKSLLHYYFRTKDRLFEAIVQQVLKVIFPQVSELISKESSLEEILRVFIQLYINMLKKHPYIPMFVLREISRNTNLVSTFAGVIRLQPLINSFSEKYKQEVAKGNFREIEPRHLIINILAMCIFPVAARPIVESTVYKGEVFDFEKFMDERAEIITDFVFKAIKV
jgi:AcrR family transcriptional regulator